RATENPRIADRTIVHDFFLGFFPAQPHELFSDTSGSLVGRGSNPSGSDVGGVIVRGDLTTALVSLASLTSVGVNSFTDVLRDAADVFFSMTLGFLISSVTKATSLAC